MNLEVPRCFLPDPNKLINGRTKHRNQKATVFPQFLQTNDFPKTIEMFLFLFNNFYNPSNI